MRKMISTFRVTLLFVTVIFMLLGCQPETNLPDEPLSTTSRFSRFVGLKPGSPFRPYLPLITGSENCTLHQLEAKEEGFRMKGSVGGLAVNDLNNPISPIADPTIVSDELNSLALNDNLVLGEANKDVAILIIDDFEGGVYQLGKDLFDFSADDPRLEGLKGEQRAKTLEAILEGFVDQGQLSHGAMVFNHTLALVQAMRGVQVENIKPDRVDFVRDNDYRVIVQAVDTQDFNTHLIFLNLKAAIEDLKNFGIDSFAGNMSFSIVPCSVLADYQYARENLGIPSFDEYLKMLAEKNCELYYQNNCSSYYEQLKKDLWQIVTTPLAYDPLEAFMMEATDKGDIIFTASSGNYGIQGLTYALAPAAWDFVISVSSSDIRTGVLSDFSNPGEVMIAGAWFNLADPIEFNGIGGIAPSLVYAGTSFSVTSITVFSAFDLSQTTLQCGFTDIPSSPDKPKLAYNSFDNKRLIRAISDYCS